MYSLAICLRDGLGGLAPDAAEAEVWLRRALEAGYVLEER
jgi:TPR repeat protein